MFPDAEIRAKLCRWYLNWIDADANASLVVFG